jgi:hypothetical protein
MVPLRATAVLLAILVVVVPTADLVAFGIHDHVAMGATDVTEVHAGHVHTSSHSAHHCHLWMNPAETEASCVLVSPFLSSVRVPAPLVARLVPRPFQPFAPPRF